MFTALAEFPSSVKDFLLDLALPRTDRVVLMQWVVMIPVWIGALFVSRKQPKDIRVFILGLIIMNLAWFGFRMIH